MNDEELEKIISNADTDPTDVQRSIYPNSVIRGDNSIHEDYFDQYLAKANAGDPEAQRLVGRHYLTGDNGHDIDLNKAKYFLTQAGENNDLIACFLLAESYLYGGINPPNSGRFDNPKVGKVFKKNLQTVKYWTEKAQTLLANGITVDGLGNAPQILASLCLNLSSELDDGASKELLRNAKALRREQNAKVPTHEQIGIARDTQPPNEKKTESKNGGLALVLYWGALFAIFGVSKVIADDDKNIAAWVFGIGIVTWFLWPLLVSLVGKNLKETKDNVAGFTYLVGLVVAGLFVLGLVSLILPSSCTRNDSPAPADIYYRR